MTALAHPSSSEFRISIRFADTVVAGLAGDLDVCTGPELAAVLGALVSRGHQTITVECDELDFIDAAGLRALVAAQVALNLSNGELHVRELSGSAHRVFQLTGLVDFLRAQPRSANKNGQTTDSADENRLIAQAADLAAKSARADVLVELLALAPRFVAGCDGASVTLRRGENFVTPGASDEAARSLDSIQYGERDGPCVEATQTGVQIYGPALHDEQRWVAFTNQARDRGVRSVLSSPLLNFEDPPTGALNLYSRTADAFAPADRDSATALASLVATLFRQPDPTASAQTERHFRDALDSRDAIAQAQGILMERHGCSPETAYDSVRRDSVRSSRPMRERAREIIDGTGDRTAIQESGNSPDG